MTSRFVFILALKIDIAMYDGFVPKLKTCMQKRQVILDVVQNSIVNN